MENKILTYSCPNCNAPLEFDPESRAFACRFCLSSFTEETLLAMEKQKAEDEEEDEARDKKEMDEDDELDPEMNADDDIPIDDGYDGAEPERQDEEMGEEVGTYICPNCGAEVMADIHTAATFCYFCHSPVVLSERVGGAIKPDKIIPFKIDKKGAKESFLNYVKKKWFIPRGYFSEKQIENITGVYFPFWVTDADTYSEYKTFAHRERTWVEGDYEYTETRNYRIWRSGNIHFEDIVTSATSAEDKKMLEGILPFPSDSHEAFQMPYLLGFSAKKRNIEVKDILDEVRGRMHEYSRKLLRDTVVGYTSVDYGNCHVTEKASHWEYTLMPVWVLTYRNKKGKVYLYAMNGHSGKLYGQLPISIAKLGALFAGIVAVAAPIISLIMGGL